MNKLKSSLRVFAGARLLLFVTLGVFVPPLISRTALFADPPPSSEISFVEPLVTPLVSVNAAHGALGLAKGDFNGDNKVDLVATFNEDLVGSFPSSGIVVLMLGNGDGSFQAPTTLFTLPANVFTRGILAKDFDRDGKLDIVADVGESKELLFFKGHGDGTFDAPIPRTTNFGPAGVQTADLNGDGNLDLVTIDPGDNAVSVLLGNGDGTFGTATDYSVSPRPWDVAIGDVDGDGDPDLVVGIFGTKVIAIMLNDGSGGFLPATNFSAAMNVRGLYLADFDGDGELDVVVAGQDCDSGGTTDGAAGMAFMKGSGTGTFSSPTSSNFTAVSLHASRQYSENVAPDINGDGKPDVVFAHEEDGNTISIGLSNGNGTFSTSFWVGWPGSGQDGLAPTSYFPDSVNGFDALAGDFNGDGVTDFAVPIAGGDSARGGVSIMLAKTPGTFQAPRIYEARNGDFRGADKPSLVLGDFTADGKVDFAVLAQGGCPPQNLFDAFLGNGEGSFDSIAATAIPSCGGGDQVLRSADLDNNGTLDLLFLSSNAGVIASGNGNGSFTLSGSFGLAAQGQNTVIADFDGNGFPDVAVFESAGCFFPNASTSIQVFLQGAGDMTFTSTLTLPVNGDCGGGAGLAAGDFDKDGKIDLVASLVTSGTNNVLFFKGDGDGTFQSSTVVGTLATQFGINDFAAADVNGDGNLDLVAAGDRVWVQLGNGDGTFQAPTFYASYGVTALKLADFDGDGRVDIAIVGGLGVEFSVLQGNGDGTFGAPMKLAIGGRASINSIDVADVNADGQPDLVVKHAATDVNNIFYTVLINNTQSTPPPPVLQSITVSPATASVAAGSTQQFTATGHYSDGSAQDLTASVTWSSSDPSIATVSNSAGTQGLATGVSAGGPVTITAMQGTVSGDAQLTVSAVLQTITVAPLTASIPQGATQQFTATGHYSDGSSQDLTTAVTWSSSNTSVATISNAAGTQGLATGLAAGGPVTITAAQGAFSGTAQLTVTSAAIVAISVTPADAQIPVGASQQYVATALFSDGTMKVVTKSATWASSNSAVATISKTGLAKAKGSGRTTISASTGGMTGSTTLTTFTLAIAPTSATIAVGGAQQFTATANFADGSMTSLTGVVTWKSSNSKVASIDASGLARGLKSGKTTIAAAYGGVSVSATLLVQ